MTTTGVTFKSHGQQLVGRWWQAKGEGAKPTMILLHGLPGIDQNHDLAHALKYAGWNSLVFHYRGCWGSEGDYSLHQVLPDVTSVLDEMSQWPEVDENQIYLFGHSMGGWAALMTGAQDSRIKGVVSAAGVIDWQKILPSKVEPAVLEQMKAFFEETMVPYLDGMTLDKLINEFQELPSVFDVSDQFNGRPLLLICGEKDAEHHMSQAALLHERCPVHSEYVVVPDADHGFSWERDELIGLVLGWVKRL